MHFLLGTSLVEYFYTDVEPGTITNAYTDENLTMFSFVSSSDGIMSINSGEFNGTCSLSADILR